MINFILAPLGVLLMVLGAAGLFVALRGPEHLRNRWPNRHRSSTEDLSSKDGD